MESAAHKIGKVAGDKAAGNRGKGRPKGVKNKMTLAVKDMILEALNSKGGSEYLARQADENPAAFMTLVGKLLPLDVKSHTTLDITMKAARDAATEAFIRTAQDEARIH